MDFLCILNIYTFLLVCAVITQFANQEFGCNIFLRDEKICIEKEIAAKTRVRFDLELKRLLT